LEDLAFGQAKINDSFNKKLVTCDKALEILNSIINSLSSALKIQLSFNKMIETQLAQLAAMVPPVENAKAVVTRGCKTTHNPPYPNHAGTHKKSMREGEESNKGPSDITEDTPGRRDPIEERAHEGEAKKTIIYRDKYPVVPSVKQEDDSG
jgi:hypothetical protein